jgi:L-threonylcarbamoyladenylate synthase
LHITDIADFERLAFNPPDYAYDLIKSYWPGPLTLVVNKNPEIPAWVGGHPTGKTETIGIRMPAHPVALELIKAAGCPIAAPSANKAGKPSPTTSYHVFDDFEKIPDLVILDGGNAEVGLESTVVDCTGDTSVILRPGTISKEEIQAVDVLGEPFSTRINTEFPRAPGMKYKHYAPRAEMTLVAGERIKIVSHILAECEKEHNCPIGVLIHEKTHEFLENPLDNMAILTLGSDEKAIAQNLYACLRQFDKMNVSKIYAESFPESGIFAAIMDRMKKAAEGRIIYV